MIEYSSDKGSKKDIDSDSIEDLLQKPILQFGASVISRKIFCKCPNAEVGKISVDVSAHEPNCEIRKRLITKGYTTDTSVTPQDFHDGYSLGVPI